MFHCKYYIKCSEILGRNELAKENHSFDSVDFHTIICLKSAEREHCLLPLVKLHCRDTQGSIPAAAITLAGTLREGLLLLGVKWQIPRKPFTWANSTACIAEFTSHLPVCIESLLHHHHCPGMYCLPLKTCFREWLPVGILPTGQK